MFYVTKNRLARIKLRNYSYILNEMQREGEFFLSFYLLLNLLDGCISFIDCNLPFDPDQRRQLLQNDLR